MAEVVDGAADGGDAAEASHNDHDSSQIPFCKELRVWRGQDWRRLQLSFRGA